MIVTYLWPIRRALFLLNLCIPGDVLLDDNLGEWGLVKSWSSGQH